MKNIKRNLVVSTGLALSLMFGGISAFADESSETTLTEYERGYLINHVGHTADEVDLLPIEVAKQLVKDEAVIEDSGSELKAFSEGPKNNRLATVLGTISTSTMKMGGTVYKVTSDKSNNDKYYIYGNFNWLKSPTNTLTDLMTFGFPSSAGFYLPTSNGAVTQHQHRYSQDQRATGQWIDYAIDYSPYDFEASAGVAGDFDLRDSTAVTLHKGYMGQYVYVPTSASGTINIKIEYGHRKISGVPSISVLPAGLSISPETNTDTQYYALTLTY